MEIGARKTFYVYKAGCKSACMYACMFGDESEPIGCGRIIK